MIQPLDIRELIVELLGSDKYLRTMERMNKSRLYDTGKDTEGKEIETFSKMGSLVYAYYTIRLKQLANLPTDLVTGYMTGKLHESIIAKVDSEFIEITADEQRLNLFFENIATSHENILGLSKENIDELILMLENDLPDLFESRVTEEMYIDTDLLKYV